MNVYEWMENFMNYKEYLTELISNLGIDKDLIEISIPPKDPVCLRFIPAVWNLVNSCLEFCHTLNCPSFAQPAFALSCRKSV